MQITTQLKRAFGNLQRRDTGSAIIELAIVFPILLLLFVGTAEVGRLFYTYTTLAKATKLGARYLSYQVSITKGSTDERNAAVTKAQNLVVCGYEDCTGKSKIVPGLDPAKVNVTLPDNTAVIKYVRVEIQNYPYTRGVFNLAAVTGAATGDVYFQLRPGTTIRYMISE